ncbi:hypothetical protein Tco_1060667 [Tanacetum coccineum]
MDGWFFIYLPDVTSMVELNRPVETLLGTANLSVSDCNKERSILAKVKDLRSFQELLKHMSSEGFDDVGLRYVGVVVWGLVGVEYPLWIKWEGKRQDFKAFLKEIFWISKMLLTILFQNERCVWINMVGSAIESLHRVIEYFIVSYHNRTYRIIATEFENLKRPLLNRWRSNPCIILWKGGSEGHSSSGFAWEEDVRGVESSSVDSFEEGEIRDDSVLYNDGCIKDCMEKNLEDDACEILGVHSHGDYGNVTTDDNEDVTPVIAPEKDSIIAPPS